MILKVDPDLNKMSLYQLHKLKRRKIGSRHGSSDGEAEAGSAGDPLSRSSLMTETSGSEESSPKTNIDSPPCSDGGRTSVSAVTIDETPLQGHDSPDDGTVEAQPSTSWTDESKPTESSSAGEELMQINKSPDTAKTVSSMEVTCRPQISDFTETSVNLLEKQPVYTASVSTTYDLPLPSSPTMSISSTSYKYDQRRFSVGSQPSGSPPEPVWDQRQRRFSDTLDMTPILTSRQVIGSQNSIENVPRTSTTPTPLHTMYWLGPNIVRTTEIVPTSSYAGRGGRSSGFTASRPSMEHQPNENVVYRSVKPTSPRVTPAIFRPITTTGVSVAPSLQPSPSPTTPPIRSSIKYFNQYSSTAESGKREISGNIFPETLERRLSSGLPQSPNDKVLHYQKTLAAALASTNVPGGPPVRYAMSSPENPSIIQSDIPQVTSSGSLMVSQQQADSPQALNLSMPSWNRQNGGNNQLPPGTVCSSSTAVAPSTSKGANDEEEEHPMICMICDDKATGLHYGIITCEG